MIDASEAKTLADQIEQIVDREVPQGQQQAMSRTGDRIITRVKDYPPETEANQPHPPYYWRRGVGLFAYPANRLVRPSQNMKEQWNKEISVSNLVVEMVIRNDATYSSYTHALPGGGQAWFHTQRGWPPLLGVALDVAGDEGGLGIAYSGRTITESEFEAEAERIAEKINSL